MYVGKKKKMTRLHHFCMKELAKILANSNKHLLECLVQSCSIKLVSPNSKEQSMSSMALSSDGNLKTVCISLFCYLANKNNFGNTRLPHLQNCILIYCWTVRTKCLFIHWMQISVSNSIYSHYVFCVTQSTHLTTFYSHKTDWYCQCLILSFSSSYHCSARC